MKPCAGALGKLRPSSTCLIWLLLVMSFSALLTTGCGSSDTEFVRSGGSSASSPTGTITVIHTLLRALPSYVTDLRFTGMDASDTVVFGPTTRTPAATITLTDVPITVVKLRIEYLGDGEVVGLFETPVTVPAGGNVTLNDPAWTDVPPTGASYTSTSVSVAPASHPLSVALGDLNKDGKLDLAVANNGSDNVSVFQGDGNGGFTAFAGSPLATGGTQPESVAVGDLDGDGNLDLAVANGGSQDVSIFHGNGDGSFTMPATFPAGLAPVSVATGDLNGDNRPDLAVANNVMSGTASVLLNAGGGVFGGPTGYNAGALPKAVAVGDLDGDGKLDLAVANQGSDDLSVLLNTGGAVFGAPTNYSTGATPSSVAIGDLDGDGHLDLVVTNGGSDSASILKNSGNGGFTLSTSLLTETTPVSVAIGDLNGDNRPDLAVANGSSNNLSTFLGNGDGTFVTSTALATGASPSSVALGDLTNDGKLDLAVANSNSNDLTVLLRQ